MVANPGTDLTFSWSFNNSINTMDIPVSFYFYSFKIAFYVYCYNDGTNSMDLDMSDAG